MWKTRSRLVASALLFFATVARADVPPMDSCGPAGSICKNAGNNADESGICKKATCSRSSPDGTTRVYECNRCAAGVSALTKGCAVGRGAGEPPLPLVLLAITVLARWRRAGTSRGRPSAQPRGQRGF
jgi:MYXO-CTERM domain-containing protein